MQSVARPFAVFFLLTLTLVLCEGPDRNFVNVEALSLNAYIGDTNVRVYPSLLHYCSSFGGHLVQPRTLDDLKLLRRSTRNYELAYFPFLIDGRSNSSNSTYNYSDGSEFPLNGSVKWMGERCSIDAPCCIALYYKSAITDCPEGDTCVFSIYCDAQYASICEVHYYNGLITHNTLKQSYEVMSPRGIHYAGFAFKSYWNQDDYYGSRHYCEYFGGTLPRPRTIEEVHYLQNTFDDLVHFYIALDAVSQNDFIYRYGEGSTFPLNASVTSFRFRCGPLPKACYALLDVIDRPYVNIESESVTKSWWLVCEMQKKSKNNLLISNDFYLNSINPTY